MVYVRLEEWRILSGTLAGFHANSTVSGLISTISGLSIGKRGGTEIKEAVMNCLAINLYTKMAADDILIFYFYLLKKIRLDFSCESSA